MWGRGFPAPTFFRAWPSLRGLLRKNCFLPAIWRPGDVPACAANSFFRTLALLQSFAIPLALGVTNRSGPVGGILRTLLWPVPENLATPLALCFPPHACCRPSEWYNNRALSANGLAGGARRRTHGTESSTGRAEVHGGGSPPDQLKSPCPAGDSRDTFRRFCCEEHFHEAHQHASFRDVSPTL
jgi:hypothetical protein